MPGLRRAITAPTARSVAPSKTASLSHNGSLGVAGDVVATFRASLVELVRYTDISTVPSQERASVRMVLSGLRVDIRNAARCSSAIAFGSLDKVNLIMTKAGESVNRISVMGRVKSGGLRLIKAAEQMGSSYRQAKRVWDDTVPVGEGVRSWRPTFSRLGLGASAETLGAGCGPPDRRGGVDASAIVSGGNAGFRGAGAVRRQLSPLAGGAWGVDA
jgi:hypothetical protein